MIRLDRTVTRKTTLHAERDHDQEAEDRAHWETRTPEQRQEILEFLRAQAGWLHRLSQLDPANPRTPNPAE